jgi:outer membrane biosynthesis protein TonB
MMLRARIPFVLLLLSQLAAAGSNKIPVGKLLDEMIHRSTLAEPGGRPFYLKATISARDDDKSEFNGTVEEYWLSSTKWRRVIKLRDFSQTRIVNGDVIYEDNNGDYFPLHDEMLANEIVDPLPKSAVDLLDKLDLVATEPGSGEGQCMAEKYFNDADGRETRVLLAYNCKTGLLIYLWSPSCCYGVMTDYRKFHGKLIAFATKDDPVNIRIDTLRDLEAPDETLFAVSEPTPLAKRITTTEVSETEARKFIAQKAEILWPTVSKKPNADNITVDIVVGRDGHVKEAWSYSPVENAIEDAVLTAVRKWTFSPQMVDGIPAQIHTKLIVPFPSELQNAAAGPDVRPIFNRMRTAGNLRLDGRPGFHMKASFHSEDGAAKGTYEETWVSPKKWRRELKLNDKSLVEVRTEDAFYRTFPGKYASRLADDVIEVLSFGMPGDNGSDLYAPDWRTINAKLGGVPVLTLSNGYVSPQGKPDPMTLQFFIEESTGFIRGRYHYSSLTIFNGLQSFGDKTVARKLTNFDELGNKIDITIDTLEPAANVSDSAFQMTGAKPIFTSEEEEDQRFTHPRALYTEKPVLPGWHGKLACSVNIDEHGHVRDVDIKGTTDQSVITAVRGALMKWEYEPATINGHPSLGFVQVNVE